MTVSKLREYMLEKVVPEKVMPQNIEALLHSDGDAELPELDAFTFLNRLRALGIGSADFIYLLKGCGAPEMAVSEIERDPAMNLQSLIVTLDSAGLTSRDYTRMLYTARQLWERTLTMQLERPAPTVTDYAEHEYAEEAPEEADYAEEAPEDAGYADDVLEETGYAEEAPEEADYAEEAPEDAGYADDVLEETGYAEEAPEETGYADDVPEEAGYAEEAPEETGYAEEVPEETGYAEEAPEESGYAEEAPEDAGYAEEAPDSDVHEALNIRARVYTETTQFMKPDPDALPDEPEEPCETEGSVDNNEADEAFEATRSDGVHWRALTAAAVGAIIVTAAGAAAQFTDFGAGSRVRYAESCEEIFAQIYTSYNSGIVGGENAVPLVVPDEQMFAGVVVENIGGQAAVSDENTVYFPSEDGVRVYERGAAGLSERDTIQPPEGARFLCIREENGALYAVFSGETSGAVRLENGAAAYVSEQDGVLTDIAFDGDEVRIGTVYVPPFTKSFSAPDVQEYLPRAGGALIDPQSVLLSGTAGCGYALAGRYSAQGRALVGCTAVLGDPVFAAADGTAGLLAEGGGLIVQPLETPVLYKTGAISAWARDGGVFALAETQDGVGRIYLRGEGMTPISGFENLIEKPQRLTLSGGVLCAYGESGIFMSADCSDPASPVMIAAEKKSGTVFGSTALVCEKTQAGIKLSLIGAGGELCAYEKALSARELETLSFCGAQTALSDGKELCGAAYTRFDGVSVVSEYVVFGRQNLVKTLYDDPTGFTGAALVGGEIFLFGGDKVQAAM